MFSMLFFQCLQTFRVNHFFMLFIFSYCHHNFLEYSFVSLCFVTSSCVFLLYVGSYVSSAVFFLVLRNKFMRFLRVLMLTPDFVYLVVLFSGVLRFSSLLCFLAPHIFCNGCFPFCFACFPLLFLTVLFVFFLNLCICPFV